MGSQQSKLLQIEAPDSARAAAEIARRNAAIVASPDFRIDALDVDSEQKGPARKDQARGPGTAKSGMHNKPRTARQSAAKRGKPRKAASDARPTAEQKNTRRPGQTAKRRKAAPRENRGWGDPVIVRSGILFVALMVLFFVAQTMIGPALLHLTTPEPLGPPITYTSESGWFAFRMRGQDGFAFTLTTQGAGAAIEQDRPPNSCLARGEAQRSGDRYIYQDASCRIVFAFAPGDVVVQAGRCKAFCGDNATLSGRFGP